MAILCDKGYGPCFGWGELRVYVPFNQHNACYSYANFEGYKIPVNSEGINMLTNKECDDDGYCDFTISSLEVWGLTLKD
jgi:hypothetical protein